MEIILEDEVNRKRKFNLCISHIRSFYEYNTLSPTNMHNYCMLMKDPSILKSLYIYCIVRIEIKAH